MSESLLDVQDLVKTFQVRGKGGQRTLRALDGVSMRLDRAETIGVVGESGCGKSTLARHLLMLERPDSGTVSFDGVDPYSLSGDALLDWRRRVQMVFQDPFDSLNSRMTAGRIVSEPWRVHTKMFRTSRDRTARLRELLQLVGLRPSDADRYPQEFSGGQRQRLGIARALALDPSVVVCDEPVSALDLSVQAQVLNLLAELQRELGVSYVFISHDLSVVRHVASRVVVMYLGRVVEAGATREVFDHPRHPYTAALMSAAPSLDRAPDRERIVLEGELPSPLNPPSGCRFRTRCWKATDICATQAPPTTTDACGHEYECHHPLVDDPTVLTKEAVS